MDCSKGTELGGNQFIGFPAKTSVVKWDHKKSSQRKRLQNCHRSGGAIASTADTKCFFGGKTQEIIAQFDSYDTVLVAYEESAKQGEKVN